MGIHPRQMEMMDPEGVWESMRKTHRMERAEPPNTDPSGLQLLQEALVSPSAPMGTHNIVGF